MTRLRPLLVVLAGAFRALPDSAAHPMLDDQRVRAEAAVAAAPADARAWTRLAQLYRYRREWSHAEAAFARALVLPDAPAALDFDLAEMRLEAGRPEDALVSLTRYLGILPEDPEGWEVRGRALEALHRPEDAATAFAAALARSAPTRPALPDTYLHWARTAEVAGTPTPQILAMLDAGVQRLQGAVALRVAALELAERRGLTEEALRRLATLEAAAHRKEAWAARRARLLKSAGRPEEARAAWKDVLAALDALPPSRGDTAVLQALRTEASAGAQR